MEIKQLICPGCGAAFRNINFNSMQGYCEYCGSWLAFDYNLGNDYFEKLKAAEAFKKLGKYDKAV